MHESPVRSLRALLRETPLAMIFGITLMAVMGVSSIAPALPKVMRQLDLTPGSVALLITVFTVPGVALTPVMGVLADRLGRRLVLGPSLLVFGVFGFACGLVRDFEWLLLLRFLEGVGASSLGALNITLIGDLFRGRERPAALGYNASVLSLGVAAYPVLGGGLAALAWYAPFLLPVLALPLGLWVLLRLEGPGPQQGRGLGQYFRDTWRVLRQWRVLGLFCATLTTFVILYGPFLTYLPLRLDRVFGAGPVAIGLVMSSMSVVTALVSSQLGRITARVAEPALIKTAFVLYAAALLGIGFAPSLAWAAAPVALMGLAQGLNMPSIQSMLTALAPTEHRAGFMSLHGMVLRLGQTAGPVFMAGVYALGGLDWVFTAGALLAVAMAGLALAALR